MGGCLLVVPPGTKATSTKYPLSERRERRTNWRRCSYPFVFATILHVPRIAIKNFENILKKDVDFGHTLVYLTLCLNGPSAPAARASKDRVARRPAVRGSPLVNAASGLDLQAPPVTAPPPQAFAAAHESIHLGPDTTCVPEELLEAPPENDRRRVMVDCAAFLLDRHLRRLVAMRNPLELRLARLLGRFEKSSSHLDLGFARMSDYV